MAFVMVWENQRRPAPGNSPAEAPPQEEFLFQPKRHRAGKTDEAARREGQVRFQHALKLNERLFVEGDEGELIGVQAGFLQTIRDRGGWKSGVVPTPAETLLLGGGNNVPIHDQGGRTIVIEGGNSKD